jgi:hypothetical protein
MCGEMALSCVRGVSFFEGLLLWIGPRREAQVPDAEYELHRDGCSQEDDQLLRAAVGSVSPTLESYFRGGVYEVII